MSESKKQHYRILYYKGHSSIIGIGDLFIDEGKAPPENQDGAFIISDSNAKPLDWNTLKETPYVRGLHPLVQKIIEHSITEELAKDKRPAQGKAAMILNGTSP